MRALFPSIIVLSATFLAPSAHGMTVEPGPTGPMATEKSFLLTLDHNGSGDSRSYIVDRRGFYERDSWSKSINTGIGSFREGEDSSHGFSSTSLSLNSSSSKAANGGGPGWSFSGGAGPSSGANNGTGTSLSGGLGLSILKSLGESSGFGASNKGSSFSSSPLTALSLGVQGEGAPWNSDKPNPSATSVSATPLPASWTLMFVGLACLGLLALFRKLRKPSAIRSAAAAP
jgi:hypothetical protein